MERLQPASWLWRTFAVIVVLLLSTIAQLTGDSGGIGLNWYSLRAAYWLLAVVGLVGYAFGRRLGSVRFWRVYALLFTAEMIVRCLPSAAVVMARAAGWPESSRHGTFSILFLLGCIALTAIALLRHAELIGRDRQGSGPSRRFA